MLYFLVFISGIYYMCLACFLGCFWFLIFRFLACFRIVSAGAYFFFVFGLHRRLLMPCDEQTYEGAFFLPPYSAVPSAWWRKRDILPGLGSVFLVGHVLWMYPGICPSMTNLTIYDTRVRLHPGIYPVRVRLHPGIYPGMTNIARCGTRVPQSKQLTYKDALGFLVCLYIYE